MINTHQPDGLLVQNFVHPEAKNFVQTESNPCVLSHTLTLYVLRPSPSSDSPGDPALVLAASATAEISAMFGCNTNCIFRG